MNMTPQQLIKQKILMRNAEWTKKPIETGLTGEQINELYDDLVEAEEHWGAVNETRSSGIDTGIKCEWSRHYESKSVAAKMANGQWVGWTYWYGGGKHGEPEAIDWMSEAYFVDCQEEEKMVVVRTFKKCEEAS